MKKHILPVLFAAILLLSACGSAAPDTAENSFTFTDDLGREVSVRAPQRVAALLGSFAQVWQLAGGYVCAAPDDAWEDLSLDMPEDAQNLGSTENLSMELLMLSVKK